MIRGPRHAGDCRDCRRRGVHHATASGARTRYPADACRRTGGPRQRSSLRPAFLSSGRPRPGHRTREDRVRAQGCLAAAVAGLRGADATRQRSRQRGGRHGVGHDRSRFVPANHLREGRNEITVEFVAGDAALNRNPEFLYTLFVPARAHLTFPVLRSAGSEGAMVAPSRVAGQLGGGGQRRRNVADGGRWTGSRLLCRDRAAVNVSLRVCRRTILGRDRGAQRPHVPDVAPRDRRRQGGAQPRGRLRSTRIGPRLARAATPGSRTRGASSTSCSSRRFSLVAWSTPERFSTTRPACCSIHRRRRTRSSVGPA